MVVHRAADVEKQQHLDLVVALRPHQDVEHPALFAVELMVPSQVELFGGAVAGEAAQAAQRDLDVARAEFHLVVQVLVFALVPHFDRGAVARPSCPMRMPSGL